MAKIELPPLKGLRSVSDMSEEERQDWSRQQVSAGKLPKRWRMAQADRLYKNQQFFERFGEDTWKKVSNPESEDFLSPEQRDYMFNDAVYSDAIKERYKDDPNLGLYLNLTYDGKVDFWNSDVPTKQELDKNIIEKVDKAAEIASHYGSIGFAEAMKNYNGREPSQFEDALYNFAENTVLRALDPIGSHARDAVKKVPNTIKEDYLNKVEAIRRRDDERVLNLPVVSERVNDVRNQYLKDIESGDATFDQVSETFNSIFDNNINAGKAGSRTWTAFKNESELADITVDDKIRMLAEYSVLSEALGKARAVDIIDTELWNHARGNQDFWDRRWNTVKGVAAKATGMLYNQTVGGFQDLYHAATDSAEEYRKFKTAEDVLTSGGLGYLLNPNYWNYVDQYGTWNPYEIQRINDNGGFSGHVNLYELDGTMNAEQFIDEGFKMVGYMLPAALISLGTRNVPVGSVFSKVVTGWEVLGSASALGSAYSSGVYTDIMTRGQQALDEQLDIHSAPFVQKYFEEHPDFVENYMKEKGIRTTDGRVPVGALVTQEDAEKALYQSAMDAYYKTDEGKKFKADYDAAQERLKEEAQYGALVDNCIETARMTVAGSSWGKWTKSKLTRNVLNNNLTPIRYTGKEFVQATTKNAERFKTAGKAILMGGVDNYLDDVTAGIGKAVGIGRYNNYLSTLFDPDSTIEGTSIAANILDGIAFGIEGAIEASQDKQSWIDGALGAAGSILGTRINAVTLLRDAVSRDGAFSREGTQAKNDWSKLSTWQKLDRYVSNGLTTSAADADSRYIRTSELTNIANKKLEQYNKDIQSLGNFLNEQYSFDAMADNIKDGKDIKQMGMLMSALRIIEAQKDPFMAQLDGVQKFNEQLERWSKGEFTEAELQEYINDPQNIKVKNSVNAEGVSNSRELAQEALQKNASNFIAIRDNYTKISKGVAKSSKYSNVNQEVKTQIAVQLALKDIWQDRLDSMQETLNTKSSTEAPFNAVAEFGSERGRKVVLEKAEKDLKDKETYANLLNSRVSDARNKLKAASTTEEIRAAEEELAAADFAYNIAKDDVDIARGEYERLNKVETEFGEDGYSTRVLSAEEIMNLSPRQRASMLNPANLHFYSTEQQAIIKTLADNLKNSITEEGEAVDYYSMVQDAADMADRLEASSKSIKEISKNPIMVQYYYDRLRTQKANMLVTALNDRIKFEDEVKMDKIETEEQAIDVLFRGKSTNTVNSGFSVASEHIFEYMESHPEKASILRKAYELTKFQEDLLSAFRGKEGYEGTQTSMINILRDSNSVDEAMSQYEEIINSEGVTAEDKEKFNTILNEISNIGYTREATAVKNTEAQRREQLILELKAAKERQQKGENYNWPEHNAGDTMYAANGEVFTIDYFDTVLENDKPLNVVHVVNREGKSLILKVEEAKKSLQDSAPKIEVKTEPKKVESTETIELSDKPVVIEANDPLAADEVTIDENGEAHLKKVEKAATVTGIPVETYEDSVEDADKNVNTDVAEETKKDLKKAANEPVPTVDTLLGNALSEYDYSALQTYQTEQHRQGANPNDALSQYYKWLENNGIKQQEIIDNEVGRIFQKYPDTKVRIMKVRNTASSDKIGNHNILVVEVTPEIEKLHDSKRCGILTIGQQRYLTIGTFGYQKGSSPHFNAYSGVVQKVNRNADNYFRANSREQYFVDNSVYTQIADVNSGFIVRKQLNEEAPQTRTLKEIIESPERNPMGFTYKNLKWYIQTGEGYSIENTINVTDSDKFYPPRNLGINKGNVFIVLPIPNGNSIPLAIKPVTMKELKEGILKDRLNELVTSLYNQNYAVRAGAIKQLVKMLVTDNTHNILIGTQDMNIVSIKEGGQITKTFDLVNQPDRIQEFIETVEDFRVNITKEVLSNPKAIEIYSDAGALSTEASKLGVSGVTFDVYAIDSQGKPIIKEGIRTYNPNVSKGSIERDFPSYNIDNSVYRKKDGVWCYENDTPIDRSTPEGRQLIKECEYGASLKFRKPATSYKGKTWYIVSTYAKNPIVIGVDAKGHIIEVTGETHGVERINNFIKAVNEGTLEQQRAKNIENTEVTFSQPAQPLGEPMSTNAPIVTEEVIIQQTLGEFTEELPIDTAQKPTVEPQVKESGTDINNFVNKSLNNLQDSGKIHTFASIYRNSGYRSTLKEIAKTKGWNLGSTIGNAEAFLKSKGISTSNIENVESWLEMIKNCK